MRFLQQCGVDDNGKIRSHDLESGEPGNRIIIECEAPEAELRRRIVEREQDASEANLEVLTHQLQTRQPLSPREHEIARVVTIDSSGLDASKIEQIRNLLFS